MFQLIKFEMLLGEVQYRQRLEDIRILKLEIKKLRREKAMLSRTVANSDELKYEQIVKI